MNNLDKFQISAVRSELDNTLVVAPPGSGKTTVIVNRVARLIEQGIGAENIIVITFTKAGADNMKERFCKDFNISKTPFFGTFHGLFYKILIRYYGKLNLINTFEAYAIIRKQLEQVTDDISDEKVREVLNYISLKKSNIDKDISSDMAIAKEIFESCYNAYESYKEYKGLLDFDDLQINTISLLKDNENLRNSYSKLFKFILVDEFQDCDDLQLEFLKLINTSVFCVGDEDQCIYSFRGSNPENMVNFEYLFENSNKVYLKYNYRSKKNIVDLSKNIIDENKLRYKKEIISNKKSEGNFSMKVPFDENDQGKFIVKEIKNSILNGNLYSDTVILYRTNMESRSVIDKLIKEKIPFRLLDKEFNFFNHFICKDILSYLKLAIDQSDKESFCRIINKPYRYISKEAIFKLNKNKEVRDCFDMLLEGGEIHPFQVKKLEELRKDINDLNKLTLRTAIDYILSDLDYLDYLKDYANKYKQKIEELIDIVEEFKEAAKDFKKIVQFFEYIKETQEKLNNAKKVDIDSVILSTIHGVKGMEFKNVHIINCVNDVIPHKSATNIEEERRILYVGMTRAIEGLSIYVPKTLKGNSTEPSDFLNVIANDESSFDYHGDFKLGQTVISKVNGEGIVEEVKNGVITVIFGNVLKRFDIKTVVEANLLEVKK
ncbi:MAG: ATP-dependent helicase [Sarcina sp.]